MWFSPGQSLAFFGGVGDYWIITLPLLKRADYTREHIRRLNLQGQTTSLFYFWVENLNDKDKCALSKP